MKKILNRFEWYYFQQVKNKLILFNIKPFKDISRHPKLLTWYIFCSHLERKWDRYLCSDCEWLSSIDSLNGTRGKTGTRVHCSLNKQVTKISNNFLVWRNYHCKPVYISIGFWCLILSFICIKIFKDLKN